MSELVYLLCVKDKGKLRVRIISESYKNESNCQFPRNLRVEGRKFTVNRNDITLAKIGNSFFYRVKASGIKILKEVTDNLAVSYEIKENLRIFGDTETTEECVVCMCYDKNTVFGPCGHYNCCNMCALTIKDTTGNCPMCRNKIEFVIDYSELN
jgi:hypothetical protein